MIMKNDKKKELTWGPMRRFMHNETVMGMKKPAAAM